MKPLRALLILATLATLGCGADPFAPMRALRPVGLELDTEQGHWSVRGVERATLSLSGWEVRVVESRAGGGREKRFLEHLVIEIVNTADRPLVVEPGQIVLAGGAAGEIALGPAKMTLLARGESVRLVHSPGVRAELLPYPWKIDLTVWRDLERTDPHTAVLHLY